MRLGEQNLQQPSGDHLQVRIKKNGLTRRCALRSRRWKWVIYFGMSNEKKTDWNKNLEVTLKKLILVLIM
jgi:hypothetical protein